MSTATILSPVNELKMTQAKIALTAIMAEALQRGFYGKVVLEINVQDGILQHIRRIIEQVEK